MKAKFFPRLKALRCIFASSWGPSKESLSLLYKSFHRPLLTYASPGWFPFLSATNITKLECLHRAASRAITGCLSSSPIPLLLTKVDRASPVIRIVKLFTQHVVRGDYWVPTNCSLTVNGGVASLIAWLDHSCQKTEVGGKQGHAPCRRILLQ